MTTVNGEKCILIDGWIVEVQVSFPDYVRDTDVKRKSRERLKAAATDSDPVNQKILKLMVDMGNTVLSKRAAADLHRYVYVPSLALRKSSQVLTKTNL